jgi:outer membrane protein OmpA-like peptidoglycan-associated protein
MVSRINFKMYPGSDRSTIPYRLYTNLVSKCITLEKDEKGFEDIKMPDGIIVEAIKLTIDSFSMSNHVQKNKDIFVVPDTYSEPTLGNDFILDNGVIVDHLNKVLIIPEWINDSIWPSSQSECEKATGLIWDNDNNKCIVGEELRTELEKSVQQAKRAQAEWTLQSPLVIYFAWNDASIQPPGLPTIQQAVDLWGATRESQIRVQGFTDRSLSPTESKKLSKKMADNVANIIAGTGVPRDSIIVEAWGENDNRVPTGPGTKEPENRRVEIRIGCFKGWC